jgi:hypothetical protein
MVVRFTSTYIMAVNHHMSVSSIPVRGEFYTIKI